MRIAGPDAPRIAQQLVGREAPFEARHATFARVYSAEAPARPDGEARAIDHVVVTWFAAPYSFTGDDVVELSGHGSPLLLRHIVERAMQLGARLAEPGEFTLRAHLNGRLDLIQAEAIADLVEAVTPLQARAAMDQLEGTLTSAIAAIDAALFDLAARLEASLDFPEEGFHFVTRADALEELRRIAAELAALARSGRSGRVIREGRTVVIAGRPNAGKSSLFNALAGASRAIVTEIPGTTRDLLTERVDIEGVPVTLVDTAGLREATSDAIEAEGMSRARQAQRVAALTLVVVDGSVAVTSDDRAILAGASGPRVVVRSKDDLPLAWTPDALGVNDQDVIAVCALSGAGLDDLRAAVAGALVDRDDLRDAPAISNARHIALVEQAHGCVTEVSDALAAGATEELVLAELASARRALEAITGTRTPDDLLRHIFGRFCIGK